MRTKTHLNISERKVLLRAFDALFSVLTLYLCDAYFGKHYLDFESSQILLRLTILICYLFLFGQIFQLYSLNVSSNSFKVVQSLFLTCFITTLFYVFTPYLAPPLPEDRNDIFFFFLMLFLSILLWRFCYIILLFSPKFFKSVVIISHSSKILDIHNLIKGDNYHRVIHYLSDDNIHDLKNHINLEDKNLKDLIDHRIVNEIIINREGFSKNLVNQLNKDIVLLFEEGMVIKSYEDFYEDYTQSIPKEYMNSEFYHSLSPSKNNDSRFYYFFHRALDIFISVFGISVFIILFPVIIVCNVLGNRGPIFYTQERIGQKGRVFRIFKLRTMIPDAEKDGIQFTTKNDKRITSFGRFLRNTRIDEMPQFVNILMGDMSIIGPRPERPEVVENLEDQIPLYAIRHVIKPGLTGWAQVNYPYAGTLEEQEDKLRFDLFYIKQQSPFLDFKIIIKTITTVLMFKGQ